MVEKRYVDVNVFVYWLGGHPEFGGRAREWVRRMESGRWGAFMTSALTLYELVVMLAGLSGVSLRDSGFVRTIIEAVSSLSGLEVVGLEWRDFVEALGFMGRYGLDFEDSVHLAVMARRGVDRIVSNDADFDRTPFVREF